MIKVKELSNAEKIAELKRKIAILSRQNNSCIESMKKNKQDIEELTTAIQKMSRLDTGVTDVAKNGMNQLLKLPMLIFNPLAILRTEFFEKLKSALGGTEYGQAKESLNHASRALRQAVEDIQKNTTCQEQTINKNKRLIQIYNNQIHQYYMAMK